MELVKGLLGVCAVCQQSGMPLIMDEFSGVEFITLEAHYNQGMKECDGSHMVPETKYLVR
jgi:hypothetical protein